MQCKPFLEFLEFLESEFNKNKQEELIESLQFIKGYRKYVTTIAPGVNNTYANDNSSEMKDSICINETQTDDGKESSIAYSFQGLIDSFSKIICFLNLFESDLKKFGDEKTKFIDLAGQICSELTMLQMETSSYTYF